MTIYLIGPSGVGKTSCASKASVSLLTKHIDTDCECRGFEYNWTVCNLALARLEHSFVQREVLQIIDIGAGTQTLPELRDYLAKRRERVVLLWAPESEVIRRNPLGPSRELDEYRLTEYTSREDLYSIASHRINVSGLAEPEANQMFANFMAQTFLRHRLASKAA